MTPEQDVSSLKATQQRNQSPIPGSGNTGLTPPTPLTRLGAHGPRNRERPGDISLPGRGQFPRIRMRGKRGWNRRTPRALAPADRLKRKGSAVLDR